MRYRDNVAIWNEKWGPKSKYRDKVQKHDNAKSSKTKINTNKRKVNK